MSLAAFSKVIPNVFNYAQRSTVCLSQNSNKLSTLTRDLTTPLSPGGLFNITMRTTIRVYFPRPSETKRIKRHGWAKRMSTPGGRRVLMNRILKGRFVYSH